MGSVQYVLGKYRVLFGKCCTFSYPLSSCGYSAPELTKLYLSCYTLGTALSCNKSCFLSCKVQQVQQNWGHSPSPLSENIGWTWQKVSTVMETHGRLCCGDCRPCFRVQPGHTHTQGFKPHLFSQSMTVQLDATENIILLSAAFLSIFKKNSVFSPCQHH